LKRIVEEVESAALLRWMSHHPSLVTSVVAKVEVARACRRIGASAGVLERAEQTLAALGMLRLDEFVVRMASRLEPATLRSLDCVHLGSAVSIGPSLAGMVTYDERLADASRSAGLVVVQPGLQSQR
jgi:predicted nucleic acid-binding protein